MNHAVSEQSGVNHRTSSMLSPAMAAGAVVIGSTLVGALLFRTHGYEVTPISLEIVRHFNLFFMLCEVAVFALAVHAGLNLTAVANRLPRADKIALLLWLASFWIGSFLSEQPAYSLVAVSSWPIHLLFGVSILHLAGRARLPLDRITGWIGVGIALAVAGLFAMIAMHFAQTPDPATLPDGTVFWAGAIPGFMSVRLFGVVMAYAGLFGAGMLLITGGTRRWQLPAALLMLGFGAMCWSSTRAAVPAFFAALLLIPLIAGCWRTRRPWLIVGVAVAAAFGLSILVPAPDSSYGTLGLFGREVSNGSGDVTSGRMEIWRAVVTAIAEQPFVGHGEGSTRWLIEQENGMHVQPHNIVLQLFQHWGVIAAFAAIWLSCRMVLAMIVAVRRNSGLMPYAMIVVAAFVAALFDGALYYPHMVMFPVAALAFVLARGALEKARLGSS